MRSLLVLLILMVLSGPVAFGSVCEDAFGDRSRIGTNPRLRWLDHLSLIQSRLGFASYSEPRFNIRIVADGRPDFSPLRLQRVAREQTSKALDKYESMGFKQQSFIQIVVEAKERTLLRIVTDEDDQPTIETEVGAGPEVVTVAALFLLPSGFTNHKLFEGKFKKGRFNDVPLILKLPARSATLHWIDEPFLIAHEIAHITENPLAHRSRIWLEARADLLTFLSTGIEKLAPAGGFDMEFYDSATNSFKMEHLEVVRDLSNPRIANRNEIVPLIGIYHQNSELISSLLFEMRARLGEAVVVEYLRWMNQTTTRPIPELRPLELEWQQQSNARYIDQSDEGVMRAAVYDEVDSIVNELRAWSKRFMSSQDVDVIETLLKQRGF